MSGYFECIPLDERNQGAELTDKAFKVATSNGVLMKCHPLCKTADVLHLCGIAHDHPDNPVDIVAWNKDRTGIAWSMRVYWRVQDVH